MLPNLPKLIPGLSIEPQRFPNEPQTTIFAAKTQIFRFLAGLRHGQTPEKEAAFDAP